ncbi:MAG: response regulator [Pseudomonadota bacterium]
MQNAKALSTQPHKASRVLIADDNPAMQEIVRTILGLAGFDTKNVDNGIAAVEAIAAGEYDLVLMDVEMPKLSGIEATKAIRALPNGKSKVPIVAFTGHVTLDDQERFYQAGMNDFAAKPIAANELVALVERWTQEKPCPAEARTEARKESPLPLFEPMTLADFEAMIGLQSTIELLVLFDKTVRVHADGIRLATEKRDLLLLSENAHDLKSVAGNCGFTRLSRHAAAIEKACKHGNAALAFVLTGEVDGMLAASLSQLRATYPEVAARCEAKTAARAGGG